jgi:hypothetical protein
MALLVKVLRRGPKIGPPVSSSVWCHWSQNKWNYEESNKKRMSVKLILSFWIIWRKKGVKEVRLKCSVLTEMESKVSRTEKKQNSMRECSMKRWNVYVVQQRKTRNTSCTDMGIGWMNTLWQIAIFAEIHHPPDYKSSWHFIHHPRCTFAFVIDICYVQRKKTRIYPCTTPSSRVDLFETPE